MRTRSRCPLWLVVPLLLVGAEASAQEFYEGTGHFYDFVSGSLSWTEAEAAASALSFGGQPGYLATITSAGENQFLSDTFGTGFAQSAWIGANDAAVEDEWRWVTGPEAGTQFWQGDQAGMTTPPFDYANWGTTEPNDFNNEDYAVFALGNLIASIPQGFWGDANVNGTGASVVGYLVEFDPAPVNVPALTPSVSAWLVAALAVLSFAVLRFRKHRQTLRS